ncbi:hypothetical protein SAMN06296008_108131 [Polynucleobacter kasalickyi]|uniref:Uncharacterized protein n=1 Tax=Polynucleobacter kasalickyi TaxID=1938817 RepID=A0A1W2AH10_9BURK|nr:hypothetical protein SAMN06296008_108131 [Polynucleobacter kasalickyi]
MADYKGDSVELVDATWAVDQADIFVLMLITIFIPKA